MSRLVKRKRTLEVKLHFEMKRQPDDTTCGPTSLQAVYSYYEDLISLDNVIKEINQFEEGGGTIAAVLGKHALRRGYEVTLVSYNVNIFDPTWFEENEKVICSNLKKTIKTKECNEKHLYALNQYVEYLELGGKLQFEDLSSKLLKQILSQEVPILTGLSSSWLYRDQREDPLTNKDDPINGDPAGHFVVINGFKDKNEFFISDPYKKNPINLNSNYYVIDGTRLINAILLGISSYDGNLLLIKKKKRRGKK